MVQMRVSSSSSSCKHNEKEKLVVNCDKEEDEEKEMRKKHEVKGETEAMMTTTGQYFKFKEMENWF